MMNNGLDYRELYNEAIEPRMMNVHQLMAYTALGRNRALEFGKESGALVKYGRRNVYDRKRVDAYLDHLAEES